MTSAESGEREIVAKKGHTGTLQGGPQVYSRLAAEYLDAVLKGDRQRAVELVMNAVNEWAEIKDIYLKVFPSVQYEVGRLWQLNKISVAQEHYCTAVTQTIVSQLFPLVLQKEKIGFSMLGCCVGKELHELGIRIVCDFFEMEGWNTYFVGSGIPNKDIIRTSAEMGVDVICISVTMTYNVPLAAGLIEEIRKSEKLSGVKVLVGGYPFIKQEGLWKRIKADGFGADAEAAVAQAAQLLQGKQGEKSV